MSPCLAHLRGGRRHGQTVEIARPAPCLQLHEDDGEAVYDLCASSDFSELIYRYSHTDRSKPLEQAGDEKTPQSCVLVVVLQQRASSSAASSRSGARCG
jgi:hypothetical protein